MLCHVYYCLFVLFSFSHGVVSLFSIYQFDCPSGIFRPSFKRNNIEEAGNFRTSFRRLRTIWKTTSISRSKKIKIFNSNVKSVLPNGADSWRVIMSYFNKLGKICNIFWPNTISNKVQYNLTLQRDIRVEIKERRLKWICNVLRIFKHDTTKIALWCTPAEGRKSVSGVRKKHGKAQ